MVDSLSGHLPVFLMLCHVLAGTNTRPCACQGRSLAHQNSAVPPVFRAKKARHSLTAGNGAEPLRTTKRVCRSRAPLRSELRRGGLGAACSR